MLSSQALDVGRSLGQGLGRAKSIAVQARRIYFRLGCHIYKVVWKPAIGEKLQENQELDNEVDKFAGKVVKNNKIVSHFHHGYSWILWYFIARGRKICVELTGGWHHCRQLCGGMEIPCRLVFSFQVKWKLIAWKNSWRARFADKHSKTQTALSGATTHEKSQRTTATNSQFLWCLFLDNLRSFMNIN